MAGIFDFIKKQTPNANTSDTTSVTDANPTMNTSNQPKVVAQQTDAPMPSGQQSYNGIGNPSNGQSYNGIGNPAHGDSYNGIGNPSHGQSYNGIGNPPNGQSYNGIGTPPPKAVNQAEPATVPAAAEMKKAEMADVKAADMPPAPPKMNDTTGTPVPAEETKMDAEMKKEQNTLQKPDDMAKEKTETSTESTLSADTQKPETTSNPAANQDGQKAIDGSVQPSAAKNVLDSTLSGKKRNDLDIMTHLTQRSNAVFVEANKKAKELKNIYMDSEHLLHGLLTDGEIYKILIDLKIQPQIVEQELVKIYKKEESQNPPQLSPRVKQIVEKSLVVARKLGYEFISPEHLLLALYEEGEGVGARILVKLGVTKEDINKRITGKKGGVFSAEATKDDKKQKQKSALQMYCIDLTQKAADGELDPVVERAPVIERVVHILSRRIKNNPALIGEPGVGKTAVVEGLAQRIVEKQVPESLLNKKILQLDLASVVAGASHRGEFEERMKSVVDELKASKGEAIMFIDEMHTMMGAGSGEGALDASNFIKPALARGEVQFIGATTITEYRKYIEKDPALERRFQTVLVPEPTEEAAIKMLKATKSKYEAFHKVKISDEVIELAVKLSKRYIGDRFLPDKAFDLMDEASAAVRLPLISLPEEIHSIETRVAQLNQELAEDERRGEKVKARILRSKIDDVQAKLKVKQDEYNMKKAQTTTAVSPEIIKDIVATRTGIPISKIGTSEKDKLSNLEDIIHKRMIDQERAVASVAQAVRRGRAGLKSNNRPIGSFVFLGPTGVGKTELAKTLAEVLFDEEEAVTRFDMTEYMERHEVAKLLGPPPGYVGFEDGGKLTEAVRRKPYSLVLFDEIEKAHPDIFNILLQILDDARLTDNKGRTISFKNTVVICTSNIGTPLIQKELLKSGKSEVAEPTLISTYAFTPRGRELMTIGNKYFERDNGTTANSLDMTNGQQQKPEEKKEDQKAEMSWADHKLTEYFAGQKIDGKMPTQKPEALQQPEPEKPEEENTVEGKEQPVKEQAKPAEEKPKITSFPTFGYDTHAISPKGVEMISTGDIIYSRTATTSKVWNVTNLIDYFNDNVVINALPDAPDEQLPTVRLKTHAFSPDEMEIVSYKDRFWRRKAGSTDWQTGLLKEYFEGQTVKDDNFPATHWDIHTFTPTGKEIVIVGNDIWHRDQKATEWKMQPLDEYFGKNFPLEKEAQEKEKVEEQTDVKKYQVIKDKVMNELLKFFRPELVNRFDEVIVFEPLKYKHMLQIVDLQLKALAKLLEEQEIGFSVTDAAKKAIVREGFDPVFGARPLRRAIQKLVENPISELIIAQKVKAGDTLIVDFDGDEFIFNVEKIELKEVKDEDVQDGQKMRHAKFFCEKCANKFETDVIPTATTICSKCASIEVQEVKDEVPQEKSEAVAEKKPENKAMDVPPAPPKKEQTNGKMNGLEPIKPQIVDSAPGAEVPPQQSSASDQTADGTAKQQTA
ncbi:AAA family ATPase [Candidatus Roizmanbacteria bacterium]|nr:MAG: AAA family ATPase [Candidatus Roizmanbacteria bacterium]